MDIELADAIARIRFGHPEVRAVVVTSASPRIFSAGANIYMPPGPKQPSLQSERFCKFAERDAMNCRWRTPPHHQGPKFLA